MDDLEKAPSRGFFFDLEKVDRIIGFYRDVLRLNGGEYEGEPYNLLDWQAFIVGSLFGWVDANGHRRFRVSYVETGKGSGKSPLAAGIGLYGLVADDEERAEIYAAATKKDQAMVLFRDAVAMYQLSPELFGRLKASGKEPSVWNLAYLERHSFFKPISADEGQSGPRPHIGLIDELHEHKTNVVPEMIRAGTKFRKQALIFNITNSGSNKQSPCREYHDYGKKVSGGSRVDDSFFAYICALDDGDDPLKHKKCWHKANPSLKAGLPGMKYLEEQVTGARGMPGKEALVRRLNFCQWTDAENPWISEEVWMGAQREYTLEDFKGRRAYAGLDLASTRDLTGLVLFIEPESFNEPWHMIAISWLPDDGLLEKEERDKVPYTQWKKQGWLKTTKGRSVSRLAVLKEIEELKKYLEIVMMGYDRWRFEEIQQLADDKDIELPEIQPFGQGFKDMSPALEKFEDALIDGGVVHNGNPIFTMCASNAVTKTDEADNKKLDKKKSTGRIDLMVAAVMSGGLALSATVEKQDIDEFINKPIYA